MHSLDRALLDVEDVVDCNAVDPRLQRASKIKLRQPRHDPYKDFLSSVFGVLTIPQHAKGEAVDVALKAPNEAIEGVPISLDRLSGQSFERHGFRHSLS